MPTDKRYYTRYSIKLKGKVAHEKGFTFEVEIQDLSIEGARLKTYDYVPIEKGDYIYLVIKWKSSIKVKAEVRWVKKEKLAVEFGVKFVEVSMEDRETLSSLISQHALTNLTDVYVK